MQAKACHRVRLIAQSRLLRQAILNPSKPECVKPTKGSPMGHCRLTVACATTSTSVEVAGLLDHGLEPPEGNAPLRQGALPALAAVEEGARVVCLHEERRIRGVRSRGRARHTHTHTHTHTHKHRRTHTHAPACTTDGCKLSEPTPMLAHTLHACCKCAHVGAHIMSRTCCSHG